MSSHYSSLLGPGSFDALSFLLHVISGIGEGNFHGLPWQVLPCIRSVVKERVALAAFSPCFCFSLSVSTPAPLGNWDSSLVIGCRCTGWKKGDVGTLACGDSGIRLLKELLALRACFNSSVAISSSVLSIQKKFACITLWTKASEMAQHGENAGLVDIKKNLRRLYELLSISVMDNREMAQVVKKMEDTVSYTSLQISNQDSRTSLQISNQDSRIDDNEIHLREVQGQVERIVEDLQKLISMNQSSRVHVASDDVALPMEEESVLQPRGNP